MEGRKHNSGLDNNDTDARLRAGHATHPSFEHEIPAKHVHGTPEEVGARVGGTIKGLPDRNASSISRRQTTSASTPRSGSR